MNAVNHVNPTAIAPYLWTWEHHPNFLARVSSENMHHCWFAFGRLNHHGEDVIASDIKLFGKQPIIVFGITIA